MNRTPLLYSWRATGRLELSDVSILSSTPRMTTIWPRKVFRRAILVSPPVRRPRPVLSRCARMRGAPHQILSPSRVVDVQGGNRDTTWPSGSSATSYARSTTTSRTITMTRSDRDDEKQQRSAFNEFSCFNHRTISPTKQTPQTQKRLVSA